MKDTNYEGLTSLEASKRLKKDGKNIIEQEKKTNKIFLFLSEKPLGVLNFVLGKEHCWQSGGNRQHQKKSLHNADFWCYFYKNKH